MENNNPTQEDLSFVYELYKKNPDDNSNISKLADYFFKIKKYKISAKFYEKLFKKDKNNYNINEKLLFIYLKLRNKKKFVYYYKRILRFYYSTSNNTNFLQGLLLNEIGEYKKTIKLCSNSLKKFPQNKDLMLLNAISYGLIGKNEDSLRLFNDLFEAHPDLLDKDFYLSNWLLKNNKRKTWTIFNINDNFRENNYNSQQYKIWNGENIKNSRLLIVTPGGLGDTIMMLRYLPLLEKLAGKITLMSNWKLQTLLTENFPNVEFISQNNTNPLTDFDEPFYLTSDLNIIPALNVDINKQICPEGYLKINQSLKEELNANAIFNTKKKKIGICWDNEPILDYGIRHNKTIPLTKLKKVFALKNIQWYSLSLNEHNENEVKFLQKTGIIKPPAHMFKDISHTIALLSTLDAVVTIDTAIAHLAGAIGLPTILMLPYNADWRWLDINRQNTNLYNSIKIIQQHKINNWDDAVKNLVIYINKICYNIT